MTREGLKQRVLDEIDVLRAAVEDDAGEDWRDAGLLRTKVHHIGCCVRDYTSYMIGSDRPPGIDEDVAKRLRHLIKLEDA